MLLKAAWATLWMLLFRAGPEDFPYSPALTRALIAVTTLVTAGLFMTLTPPVLALAFAAGVVGAVAATTWMSLKPRGLENRFQQTLAALLAVFTVHGLMLLPVFLETAPIVMKLMNDPATMEKIRQGLAVDLPVPRWAATASDLLFLWNFAVTLNIFRRATSTSALRSLFITLACAGAAFFFMLFAGFFATLLFGVQS